MARTLIPLSHAAYVLDSSVAVKWFTNHREPDRAQALAIRERKVQGACELIIPEFFLLELANALRLGAKVSEAVVQEALHLVEGLHLRLEPLAWDRLRKVVAIAYAYRVTLYDAAYVALAESLGWPLVTADHVLAERLAGHSIVLRLTDLKVESPR